MPIDPTARINNWTLKTTPERSSDVTGARMPTMKINAGVVFTNILAMEVQVRQVCNGAGVPTIQYPFYLNFGREMWALVRRGITGESLAVEAAVLIAKWVAQGLTQSVLQAIRTDVFNVSAPVA